jgi:hypothetical protein
MKKSDVPEQPCDGIIEKTYSRNYEGFITLCDSSVVSADVYIERVTYGKITAELTIDSLALDTTLYYDIKCRSLRDGPSVKLYDESQNEKGYYDHKHDSILFWFNLDSCSVVQFKGK